MKQLTKLILSTTVAAAAAVLPSLASAIVITSTTQTWSNAVGGSNIQYNLANGAFTDVRWGISTGSGQSGLGFDPANPPSIDYPADTDFLLGTVRHYNKPIQSGTAASSVDLALLSLITGASPTAQTFAFRFLIDETPNTYPCAYWSTTPCADRISFQNLDLTSAFSIGGVSYTITLTGFSSNGGATIRSYFDSQEGGTNAVGLYARITESARITQGSTVPEPGTLALLGIGLAGLAVTRKRRQ